MTTPLFGPPTLRGQLPNMLTASRLGMAVIFFAVLSVPNISENQPAMLVGAIVFIIAALTDALDGHLARRWKAISIFGRVMDPFADKVLVLGAFVMLASAGFEAGQRQWSGVMPWMVVIILARELLVTSIRGVCESRGIDFSATLPGKVKMIVQSAAIPAILLVLVLGLNVDPNSPFIHADHVPTITGAIAWIVTIVTVWSGIPYVMRAMRELPRSEAHT